MACSASVPTKGTHTPVRPRDRGEKEYVGNVDVVVVDG
jgi:hypothetical protein